MGRKKRKNRVPKQRPVNEAQQPEVLKDAEKERTIVIFRDKMDALLKVGFLAGAIGAAAWVGNYNCKMRKETQMAEASVPGHKSNGAEMEKDLHVQEFDPRMYQPPKEGRIWKQSETLDPNKQTIIYIPDIHGLSDRPDTWPVQKEIFAIVEDGIEKYGHVSVVIESWTDFGEGQNYDMNIRQDLLYDLVAESDLSRRIAVARNLMSNGRHRAPDLLPAVYQKEVTPVPSHDLKQDIQTFAETTMLVSIVKAREENSSCKNFGLQDSEMGVDDAMRRVHSLTPTKEAYDCYCTFDGLFESAHDDFKQGRAQRAATEEIRRAEARDVPVIYVIAGTGHTEAAVQKMEETQVNYFVVSPRSNDMKNINLDSLERFKNSPLCRDWRKSNKETVSQMIQSYRVKFRHYAEKTVQEEIERFR